MAKPKHTAQQSATPTQPAPAAPQAAQPATPAATSAAPVNSALAVLLQAGKPYNVRTGTAQANDRSWQAIQAVLAANGGQATREQVQAAVAPYNHVPFVGYCIRRGWLVPVANATVANTTQPAAQPASTQAAA